jgi:hypothetical protein
MEIKAKRKGSLPNNWKAVGLKYDAWKKLNDGEAISVESVPSGYDRFVDAKEGKPSASSKPSGKAGK